MNLYAFLQDMNNYDSGIGEHASGNPGADGSGSGNGNGHGNSSSRLPDGRGYDHDPPIDRLGFPLTNFDQQQQQQLHMLQQQQRQQQRQQLQQQLQLQQQQQHHEMEAAASSARGLLSAPLSSGMGAFSMPVSNNANAAATWSASDLQPRPFAPNSFGAARAPMAATLTHQEQHGLSCDLYSSLRGLPLALPPANSQNTMNQLLGGERIVDPFQMATRVPSAATNSPNNLKASIASVSDLKAAGDVFAKLPPIPPAAKPQEEEDHPGQHLVKGMFGSKKAKVLLPADFEPSEYTVILGRGRCTESIGNKRFKAVVQNHLQEYLEAPGKLEKTFIVTKVMNIVRESCPVGAFVKYENGRWWTAGERAAREKVGASFRDALHNYYKSSSKSKVARRKAKEQEWSSGGAANAPKPPF